jgi:hypothetical protein
VLIAARKAGGPQAADAVQPLEAVEPAADAVQPPRVVEVADAVEVSRADPAG